MRRSRSSTSIPVPVSLQNRRESRTKERAKSGVRTSREPSLDSQTPLARQRLFSGGLGQWSSQTKMLKTPTTPSSLKIYKRSSSLSSFGSRVSTSRPKSPGSKKTLQKLINDKKWVAEQYAKVQDFIRNSGLFDPELATQIRPPTMAMFVNIVSTLLRQIIKTIPINLQNYGDEVMNKLKLLQYPGQITASTLKTVNTMHGWPNFIAIVSWLMDRVNLAARYSDFREQQEEEVKKTTDMYDAVLNFFTMQHVNLQEPDENGENLQQLKDQFYERMLQITGIDNEAALKINDLLENERQELATIDAHLQEIEEENKKTSAQNVMRQNVIDKFRENSGCREQEIKEEIGQLQKDIRKLAENQGSLVCSIKQLENSISQQSCKYEDKIKMLNQIEDLKRLIERKEAKLNEYRVIRDDLDLKLRTLVVEVESKVDAWNVSITRTFLPELSVLRLREKGFHSDGFLKEIVDIRKKKTELQEELLKECKMGQSDLEKLRKQKSLLIERGKAMDDTEKELDDLMSSIQLLEEQNRNMVLDMEECKKSHETKMKRIRESEESIIKEREVLIADLNKRIEDVTQQTDLTAQKGLSVIVEAHNTALSNIQKVEESMHSMLQEAAQHLTESTQNLRDSFDCLKRQQRTTAKLFNAVDEEN